MTIATTADRITYAGDGSTDAFAFPYKFSSNADLIVYLYNVSTGDGTPQVLGTHYTATGATLDAGGTVTFTTAPASGYNVVIIRDPAITQATSYSNSDPFPAKSHENALDKLTMICQRVRDLVGRALVAPDSDPPLALTMPSVVTRANKLLGFDSDGVPIPIATSNQGGDGSLITVLPTGATTARSLANRFSTYYTPEDFGAIGNGIANDTAALAAAVSACNSGRKALLLVGTYLTTTSIDNLHTIRYLGSGRIKRGSAFFAPNLVTSDTNTLYVRSSGIDTNDGLSTSQAFLTNAAAVDAINNYAPVKTGSWLIDNNGSRASADSGLTTWGLRPAIVCTKGRNPNQDFQSGGGTYLCANTRTHHTSLNSRTVTDLQLVYGNWNVNFSTPDVLENDGPNNITIRAAIENPVGTYIPVYFNGKRDVTIEPGGNAVSDPLGIEIAANVGFFIRTMVLVAANTSSWPISITTLNALAEGVVMNTTSTDLTTSGTIGATNSAGLGPIAILGYAIGQTPLASVGIIGDSIADGVQELNPFGTGNTQNYPGYIARGLSNSVGWTQLTRSSDSALYWSGAGVGFGSNHKRRMSAASSRLSHVVCNLGINDVVTYSLSLANVQAGLLNVWNALAARKIKVFQTTLLPVTTSTDSWATLANQTVGSQEAVRVAVNNWIRTVPAPLSGIYEAADLAETSRNSGKWITSGSAFGYTIDGIHPNSAGHQIISACIDAGLLI